MEQELRRITLVLQSESHYYFQDDQQTFFSFSYSTLLDPYDNLAAARFLFELTYKQQITDTDAYVQMLMNKDFRNILKAVNLAVVVESNAQSKVMRIDIALDVGVKISKVAAKPHHYLEFQPQYSARFAIVIPEPKYFEKWEHILEGLHLGMYKEVDEKWEVYLAINEEFPEDLESLDACIITGSSSASYDMTLPWIHSLYKNLQKLYASPKCKILGVCFGHQVLAAALGGSSAKMTQVDRFQVGRIQLPTKFEGRDVNVYIFHGDQVTQPPPNTQVFLKANHCDCYAYSNERMMCVQFHPEFNPTILLYILVNDPLKEAHWKEYDIERCKKSLESGRDDSHFIWGQMISFLKK